MALLSLAGEYGKEPVPMSRIAKEKSIPIRFLEGIFLQLKRKGFLDSTRGIDGGYFLIQSPADVLLSDVVQELEGSLSFVSCSDSCSNVPECEFNLDPESCGIRRLFSDIHSDLLKRLSHTTLADLL